MAKLTQAEVENILDLYELEDDCPREFVGVDEFGNLIEREVQV
jgi:hypothetical protein